MTGTPRNPDDVRNARSTTCARCVQPRRRRPDLPGADGLAPAEPGARRRRDRGSGRGGIERDGEHRAGRERRHPQLARRPDDRAVERVTVVRGIEDPGDDEGCVEHAARRHDTAPTGEAAGIATERPALADAPRRPCPLLGVHRDPVVVTETRGPRQRRRTRTGRTRRERDEPEQRHHDDDASDSHHPSPVGVDARYSRPPRRGIVSGRRRRGRRARPPGSPDVANSVAVMVQRRPLGDRLRAPDGPQLVGADLAVQLVPTDPSRAGRRGPDHAPHAGVPDAVRGDGRDRSTDHPEPGVVLADVVQQRGPEPHRVGVRAERHLHLTGTVDEVTAVLVRQPGQQRVLRRAWRPTAAHTSSDGRRRSTRQRREEAADVVPEHGRGRRGVSGTWTHR